MNQIPNRLLIIDDEAGICDFVSGVAEKLGYEVRATGDPNKFLSLLGDFKPSILILDLNMPEVDGIELLRIWLRFSLSWDCERSIVLKVPFVADRSALGTLRCSTSQSVCMNRE